MLLNLLGNAIKFTEQGDVRIKVDVTETSVIFRVIDTGIGMSKDVQGKLFQEFTKADSSIASRFGGTALGLSISKRIVEQMDGTITVESEPGKGSTFTVCVPRIDATEATAQPAEEAAIDIPPLNVLVAEDNSINQKVARWVLEKQGHSVEIVATGQDAVDRVRTARSTSC